MPTTPETTTDGSPEETDNTTSTAPTDSSSLTTPESTILSNVSITTLHNTSGRKIMDAGTGVGVAIAVGIIFLGCMLIFYYLRKTGRLKCLSQIRGRPRRSSTSSSRRPLEPDDGESVDNMPQLTDGDMFAITDPDENGREIAGDDGYFYDEVFGSSAFEDETTNVSNKELFSVSSDPEVPDLLLRVDNFNTT